MCLNSELKQYLEFLCYSRDAFPKWNEVSQARTIKKDSQLSKHFEKNV